MSCLMINDIDAGLGRFGELQLILMMPYLLYFQTSSLLKFCSICFVSFVYINFHLGPLTTTFQVSFNHRFCFKIWIILCCYSGNTQMTVNNQIVVGTLMNLADNPTRVSVGQDWRESDITNRIPIIVTGNDFSTIYAPLIRDGRMEKFYWYIFLIESFSSFFFSLHKFAL